MQKLTDWLLPRAAGRARITRLYRVAVGCYALPWGLFGLAIPEWWASEWLTIAAGLSWLPLSTVGLACTGLGLRLAFQTNDYEKKDIGYANLLMGLVTGGVGLLGAAAVLLL